MAVFHTLCRIAWSSGMGHTRSATASFVGHAATETGDIAREGLLYGMNPYVRGWGAAIQIVSVSRMVPIATVL